VLSRAFALLDAWIVRQFNANAEFSGKPKELGREVVALREHPFAKLRGIREIQPNVADRVRCRQATQYRFMLAKERVSILNTPSRP